jgi:sensor histidine kinase YesM
LSDGPSSSDWYFDTGAYTHMTPNSISLDSSEQYVGKNNIVVGNKVSLPITRIDTSHSLLDVFPSLNVLLVSCFTKKLLLISKLTFYFHLQVIFIYSSFIVQNRISRKTVTTKKHNDGLYMLEHDNACYLYFCPQ